MTTDPPPSPAAALAEHLTTCHPVSAAIVMQSGSADPEVAKLLAAEWTYESVEYVAGKRIRYLRPPRTEETP